MKVPNILRVVAACISLGVLFSFGQSIPTDAKNSCTVSSAQFKGWFQSGTPAVNGVVLPANSVTFSGTPNCDFYKWSKQMFLWLTSPAPTAYGGGTHIFDSPTFYDVTPVDAAGQRTLLQHKPGLIRVAGPRLNLVGPNGLPLLTTKSGRTVELQRPLLSASGKQLIGIAGGKTVEIDRATLDASGKLSLLDKSGKKISPVLSRLPVANRAFAPRALTASNQFSLVQQIQLVDGRRIFIGSSGNPVEVEQGESDSNVILDQNKALVYYAIMVNDVYAYFMTGAKDGAITPNNVFPTSASDLTKITTFASAHGKTFPDPDALAIEVKSSWVEASTLASTAGFITVQGTIPTYNKSNPKKWVQSGTKDTTLALVGMHVVGSTNQHPEMVWATFEHFGNAPNGTYRYVSNANSIKTVNQSTTGPWLFTSSGAGAPFNVGLNTFVPTPTPASIQSGSAVTTTNVIRWKAFAAAFNQSPNPIDGSDAASNSEIISIHNSVAGLMPAGDVRMNYYMSGSTWDVPGVSLQQVGTSQLGNSTMETFQQGLSNSDSAVSCLSCHSSKQTNVSFVYPTVKPLF